MSESNKKKIYEKPKVMSMKALAESLGACNAGSADCGGTCTAGSAPSGLGGGGTCAAGSAAGS